MNMSSYDMQIAYFLSAFLSKVAFVVYESSYRSKLLQIIIIKLLRNAQECDTINKAQNRGGKKHCAS